MPTLEEKVLALAEESGGYVSVQDANRIGVPRSVLADLARGSDSRLERVSNGLYMLPGAWEDTLVVLQHRFTRGIFSNVTALYLHDLTDQMPHKWEMTFPAGYNTSPALREGVRAHTCKPGLHELGVMEVSTTFGNRVRAYSKERTLCDLVKGTRIDIQIEAPAFKNYLHAQPDLPLLYSIATKMNVRDRIDRYVEVLL